MDTNGVIMWAVFLLICAVIIFFSRRMKRQIEEEGLETVGVVSRIVDEGGADEVSYSYYARYRTRDGEEIEGLILNPSSELEVGQRVNLKYHPKYRMNARLI